MKHLRYDCGIGTPDGHPQEIMKKLGITYFHATPQSMGDQWQFWCCENIPKTLPDHIELMDMDPMEQIGWGLSKATAIAIRDYDGVVPKPLTSDQEKIKELEDDIRKIKLIMTFPDRDKMEVHYDFSFNDIELTKINWASTGKQVTIDGTQVKGGIKLGVPKVRKL